MPSASRRAFPASCPAVGDHARVGLVAALGGDHLRHLGGEVDVRHLELAADGRAEAGCRGRADDRRTRVGGCRPTASRRRVPARLRWRTSRATGSPRRHAAGTCCRFGVVVGVGDRRRPWPIDTFVEPGGIMQVRVFFAGRVRRFGFRLLWRPRCDRSRIRRTASSGSPACSSSGRRRACSSTFAGRPLVNGALAGGSPAPTRRKPPPSIATSSGLPVVWKAPSVISLRVALTCTPSPICTGLEPPLVLGRPRAPRGSPA